MTDNTEEHLPFRVPEIMPAESAVDGINGHDARLIFDLVSNIRPKKAVLDAYGLTVADLQAKAQNPLWAGAYRETERVWKSDMNVKQRIQLKASFLLEDSLPSLFNIIRQDGISISAKLAAIEQLTKISTVSNVPKEAAMTEKHNIVINIGGGAPPITVTAETASEQSSLTVG